MGSDVESPYHLKELKPYEHIIKFLQESLIKFLTLTVKENDYGASSKSR
jgi:hypothetical protein